MSVKNRRINTPNQIKAVLQEQINILRQDESLDKVQKSRAIAYLSNTALSALNDGELLEKVKEVENLLKKQEG